MMKRLLFLFLALVRTVSLLAYTPEVKDLAISVSLQEDGTANITEVWDVVVASGTEWYLVRENLGDIRISDLAVTDEQGHAFRYEGAWDVDRSISEKARKCGLHQTDKGYEICWGVESYGPHKWRVSYTMSNCVKTLTDHDMLHMQFVSDGLSSPPRHVLLTLQAPVALSEENSNIWAFGYDGSVCWNTDGTVEAESDGAFEEDSSLILLIRFDKGIFQSPSVQERDFQTVLDRAREGAHFGDEEEESKWYEVLLGMLLFCGMVYAFVIIPLRKVLVLFGLRKERNRRRIKEIFGVRRLPSKPAWNRDIPFQGDFLETYYIASHEYGLNDHKYTVVSAMILRMVNAGVITVRTDARGKKEFVFSESASTDWMMDSEKAFLELLKKASGADGVLQEKEFNRWADAHPNTVKGWVSDMEAEVLKHFEQDSLVETYASRFASQSYYSMALNGKGRELAMQALGFRQFLKDFTLIDKRYTREVALWGDYLVVASLFGMAREVAKEMKRIAPDVSVGPMSLPVSTLTDIVILSNTFRSYASSAANYTPPSSGSYGSGSSGGFGGRSSFGGGGGFSGGGRGGGSR
ncbi:MAG: DUF2207 domain-containing protein [Bacteroidales bacterium]|nr:DUF2207 domain-containing protein [Bacteroidales bacterium]